MRLGLGLLQEYPPDDLIRIVRLAEELGYDTFWYGNEKYWRDPWIGLAVAATNTSRIKLGTFITDPYTTYAALTAVAIATLDELSHGRAILLMGAGGGGGGALGYDRRKPPTAIRETIQVVRGMLRGEHVRLEGEHVKFHGGKLTFQPVRPEIPIYVASRGNRVLEMAGEVADGVMIATYATPPGVRHALERIDAGLAKSGRSRKDVKLFSRIDAWLDDDDPEGAREAVAPMVARLLTTSYPDKSFVDAVGLTIPPELEEVLRQKDRDLAARSGHLVPKELVDAFTWWGSAEQVADRVRAVAALGVEDITVLFHPPHGKPLDTAIRRFMEVLG
ncbi:MAG: LLM class flavin-dependent oxidoreductase [Chloroflexota bacterium]